MTLVKSLNSVFVIAMYLHVVVFVCFRLQSCPDPVQVSIVFSGGKESPANEMSKTLKYVSSYLFP